MRGLLQRVEIEPTAGRAQRSRVVALRRAAVGQPRQHGQELPSHRLRLRFHPGLERRRLTDHEALEQVPSNQLGRLVVLTSTCQLAEPEDVDPQSRAGRQGHVVAVGVQQARPEGGTDRRQGPAQRAPRVGEVVVRPQQVGHGVPRPGAA